MNMAKIEPFESFSEEYDEWFVKNKDKYEAELHAIRNFIPSKGNGLEVGVGSGKFAAPLGIKTGIEPSEKMAEKAKGLGIKVINGIAEDLPFQNRSFDFVLIDGWDRHGCVLNALAKLRPGGCIYLDNSDKDMTRPDGDLRRAEQALLAAVDERGGTARYFVDFSPTNFFVEQGLLAKF